MKRLIPVLFLAASFAFAEERDAASPAYIRSESQAKHKRPATIPFPPENAFSQERELLGRTLFFDPRLSGARNTSCATCHNPGLAWTDGLERSIGKDGKELSRRTPTILNVAWSDLLFWDGRAETLEEQGLGPLRSPDEMNLPLGQIESRILSIPGYRPLFEKAYPGEPVSDRVVTKAIATFERTLISGTAPFDQWIGGDETAISTDAQRGFDLFQTRAGCAKCHIGWNFTDDGFHDTGVSGLDKGRGVWLPLEAMQHAFKTPGLREIDIRGPYMHDGSEATLEAVVEFYDSGGRERRPSLSPEVAPLHLTAGQKHDLVAFLHTLTGAVPAVQYPALPH